MADTEPAKLAAELRRTARQCEETLAAHGAQHPRALREPFAAALLVATAALEAAADSIEARPERTETALLIASTLAREAAATARRDGTDVVLLGCAKACEQAAALCEAALRAG